MAQCARSGKFKGPKKLYFHGSFLQLISHRAPLLSRILAMHTRFALIVMLMPLMLLACPESDDAIVGTDSGLKQWDILVDKGDAPPPPDIPPPPDLGKEVVDKDTKTGCKSDQDCEEPGIIPATCTKRVCDVMQSKCVEAALPDNSPCDDENACTQTVCQGGLCFTTGPVECNDGNQCTEDACKDDTGCIYINSLLPCDDGDPCTDGDKCGNGVCNPGEPSCDPGTIENPANSCDHIAKVVANAKNGVYFIKAVGGGAPLQVYCNLQSAPGTGWIRVAVVKGEQAICSYGAGIGNAADLLGNPTVTTAMSGAAATKLPIVAKQIMVLTSLGRYVFMSTNAQWGWLSVSSGAINSSNLADYGVEGSSNGGPFIALKSIAIGATKGAVMLGAIQASDNKYTPFIGIGAQLSGAFNQNDACKTSGANLRGVFGGTVFPGGSWNNAGEIFVR